MKVRVLSGAPNRPFIYGVFGVFLAGLFSVCLYQIGCPKICSVSGVSGRSSGLRQHILRVKFAIIFVSLSLIVAATFFVLLPGFQRIEDREAVRNWIRVTETFAARADVLNTRIYDWADWDDAYFFIRDQNQQFIDANVPDNLLEQMEISSMDFLDKSGQPIYSLYDKGLASQQGKFLFDSLGDNDKNKSVSGMAGVDGKVFFFALRPVTRTGVPDDSSGWILWTQEFDRSFFSKIAAQLDLDIQFDPMTQGPNGVSVWLDRSDTDFIGSLGAIRDFQGRELGILRVNSERAIFGVAVQTLRKMVVAQAVIFLIALWSVSLLISRTVVRRLEQMELEVRAVDPVSGDGFVTAAGSDEISRLAEQINLMLGSLSDSASEIEGQREELVDLNESLERTIFERTERLERMNSILQHALDGIAELSADGVILAANAAIHQLLGSDQVVGRKFSEWILGSGEDIWGHAVANLSYKSRVEAEIFIRSESGEHRELQVVLVRHGNEQEGVSGMHIFVKDVTEYRQVLREMEHQARRDMLTGLGNRRFLHESLDKALKSESGSVICVFIDLDNFKLINDSRGHKVGDRLLRTVAELMISLSDMESDVFRMGGDEFMVVLKGDNALNRGVALSERILEELSHPLDLGDSIVFVTCSIGLAEGICSESGAVDLIRDADTAMYQAKANGKAGYAIYDEAMKEMVMERLELEEGLRRAIESYQLVLVYQPIVDLVSGAVTGVEALLRWNHPKLGSISPVKFIPIAEETGLIIPIGEWVLNEAMRAAEYLERQFGLGLQMNINLSQRQISSPNIADVLEEILGHHDLGSSSVMLEVTESMAMSDIESVIVVLKELKSKGVGLAIDDFGTGFSSLSYLQQMPVDKVKIDRAFVRYLGRDSRHTEVIEAILRLCDALKLKVVAEGIETREQLDLLTNLGCDFGQGYHFARPMNLRALEGYLTEASRSDLAA